MNADLTHNDGASRGEHLLNRVVVMRDLVIVVALLLSISLGAPAQQNPDLDKYFRQYVGLSEDQIAAIRNGQPVTKALPSRTPDEVFLFGAIYVHTAPEKYVQFAHDYNRLRKLPSNLALGVFSNPPTLSDLKDFTFDTDDIKAVKNCKPGDCLIRLLKAPSKNCRNQLTGLPPM